jgi:GTP cyclohydrolase I
VGIDLSRPRFLVATIEAEQAVKTLLGYLGEDPERNGLADTPGRVVRALAEMTAGYAEDPGEILDTTFDDSCDQMVLVRGVEFTSLCEHHILPFIGTATVGYIPDGQVVGLSKLARLVECYARRLQVQERMTEQIADAIDKHLGPLGVGVVVRARHLCMGCRGIRKPGAEMVTSALRGNLLALPAARAEFMQLALGVT